jgi:hypothetical protein
VGRTVDECVYLFCLLEKTCQQQLLAEAAEANGLTKRIIAPQDAAYTQESNGYWETMYNNVSLGLAEVRITPAGWGVIVWYVSDGADEVQFQPEFELLKKETNGDFLL